MTIFACYCRDAEGSGPKREEHFASHLANIEANMAALKVAGPLKDGDHTVGSLLIVEAEDAAAARTLLEQDPYYAAGVWDSIMIDQFLGVAGGWVGGATWKK
jgi:uncharacterized protein YciI